MNLTKPRITTEMARDEYQTRIVLRYRRNWKKMAAEEREAALLACADHLETVAAQMREEANGLDGRAINGH